MRFTRNRIPVATAVGYPDGSSTTAAKLYEGRDLLRRGAREIEMLPNIGKLLSRQFQYIETELMQMAKSCLEEGVTFKVSLGRFALPDDLKIITLKIAKRIEAAYFSLPYQPASLALLTPLLKERISLRAAGGVINLDLALQARDGGCARIATAQTAAILDAWKSKLAPKEVEQGTDASPGNGMIS
ncbi:MAG TPA: hypothetical protein VE621_24480 [Bryobacteraceae bacterium]|nr:hypothetical protein [Bryobacteraceae bacterium]